MIWWLDADFLPLHQRFPLYWWARARWEAVRDFFLRIWYCHHNARVIADFEERMVAVLCAAGTRMSKPYYTKEAMVAEIEAALTRAYIEGYEDAKLDYEVGNDD